MGQAAEHFRTCLRELGRSSPPAPPFERSLCAGLLALAIQLDTIEGKLPKDTSGKLNDVYVMLSGLTGRQ